MVCARMKTMLDAQVVEQWRAGVREKAQKKKKREREMKKWQIFEHASKTQSGKCIIFANRDSGGRHSVRLRIVEQIL